MSNYSVAIETITPDKAVDLLAKFVRNRRTNNQRVKSYADIMTRGQWAPLSMVVIDENGDTVDGHHRLEAVVKSGVTVDMVVFRGLDRKYIPFIDTGRPRSAGDMLSFIEKLDGLGSFRNIACIARGVLYYNRRDCSAIVPADELANFIVDNRDSVELAYSDYGKIRGIGGTLNHAAALYVIRKACPEMDRDINLFVEQIAYGENIKSGMPSYAARNAIFSFRGKSVGSNGWRCSFYTILRAWKAFVDGESLDFIRTGSATTEKVFAFSF